MKLFLDKDSEHQLELKDVPPARSSIDPELKKIKNITIQSLLGMGQFGEVYKAVWENTTVAIKKLRTDNTEFEKEATFLQKLHHPSIQAKKLLIFTHRFIVFRLLRNILWDSMESTSLQKENSTWSPNISPKEMLQIS